jgi:pimeloyl-ACP methyl ester carboxylesterase
MSQRNSASGERFAAVNGVSLCYETFGKPNDPALLLIMGLGAHMTQWDDGFCETLAERGFHVIRFDNRDVGRSTKIEAPAQDVAAALAAVYEGRPAKPPYSLEDMARDALGLLDHLGAPRAHVVGFSLGGMIAQVMALDAPERLASLTLMATRSGETDLPAPGPEFAAIFAAPPPRNAAEYVEANVRAWKVMRPAWIEPQEDARDRERAERASLRSPLCPEGGGRQFLAAATAPGRRSRLAEVKAPTLVIQGAADPLCPAPCGEDLARSIPGAKLMLVERMGHNLPKALWPEFADAIAANARRSL